MNTKRQEGRNRVGATKTATVILFLVVSFLQCGGLIVFAQEGLASIRQKNVELSSLASQATSSFHDRCQSFTECTECTIPACGSSVFQDENTFECNPNFGVDAATCGNSCGMKTGMEASVLRVPPNLNFTEQGSQEFACASKQLETAWKSIYDREVITAWQYVAHVGGTIRIFPAAVQGRDSEQCSRYDPRIRPWYLSTSSGPKDIVLVYDNVPKSAATHQKLTEFVLGFFSGLELSDFFGVVQYDESARSLYTDPSTGKDVLLRASSENLADMIAEWPKFAPGGSGSGNRNDYAVGLAKAFEMLANSEAAGSNHTSGCTKLIVFLAAGEPDDGISFSEPRNLTTSSRIVKQAIADGYARLGAGGSNVRIFPYSFDNPNMNQSLLKSMACQNGGLYKSVTRDNAVVEIRNSLYRFLAAQIIPGTVRWTRPYEDAFGLGQVVTAGIPLFLSGVGGIQTMYGVLAADVTLNDLNATNGVSLLDALIAESSTCQLRNLTECQLQLLRAASDDDICGDGPPISSCTRYSGGISTCPAQNKNLNDFLCEPLDETSRVAATNPEPFAEVACCAASVCAAPASASSTTIIIIVLVVVAVVIIIVVVVVVVVVRKGGAGAGTDVNDQSKNDQPARQISVVPIEEHDNNPPTMYPRQVSTQSFEFANGSNASSSQQGPTASASDGSGTPNIVRLARRPMDSLDGGYASSARSGDSGSRSTEDRMLGLTPAQRGMAANPTNSVGSVGRASNASGGGGKSSNQQSSPTRTEAHHTGGLRPEVLQQLAQNASASQVSVKSGEGLFAVLAKESISADTLTTSASVDPNSLVDIEAEASSGGGQMKRRQQRSTGQMQSATTPWDLVKPSVATFKQGKLLGSGAFGTVFLGLDTKSGKLLAAKEMTFGDAGEANAQKRLQSLASEISMMKKLNHPRVVRYLGADRKGNSQFVIFMEYVPGGSLLAVLEQFGCLSLEAASKYAFQILEGLEYLHENDVVHRDLKAANVLLDSNGDCKLADLGAAQHQDSVKSLRGTPFWMAPEVIREESEVGAPSDIWSLGCTVIELLTAKHPFSHLENALSVMYHLGMSNEEIKIPDTISDPVARDFIFSCLRRDALLRPSATELLEHPFIADQFRYEHQDDVDVGSPTAASPAARRVSEAIAVEAEQQQEPPIPSLEEDRDEAPNFNLNPLLAGSYNPDGASMASSYRIQEVARETARIRTASAMPDVETPEAKEHADSSN